MQKQIDIYEYRLDWQGANPRGLDKQELKTVNTAPRHEDPTSDKFRASVKSPKSALRAYCVSECMAGQPGLVRECMSLECPLWPFRMGKDPFRGMELPKVDEVIAEGDVLEDEFDDFEDDEDDEDEGDD